MSQSGGEKPLEWARAARDAFEASIDFIAGEDPGTARLVVQRVENALRQIQAYPKIGTVAGLRGRRFRFRTPATCDPRARDGGAQRNANSPRGDM